jgi:hypothetical protein
MRNSARETLAALDKSGPYQLWRIMRLFPSSLSLLMGGRDFKAE